MSSHTHDRFASRREISSVRALVALLLCLLASACGDSKSSAPSVCELTPAPTAVAYGTTAAVYTRGAAIASNTPKVTGTVTAWSVTPSLPAGLTFDKIAGVIAGTPSGLQAATSYTVVAANGCGSTTAALSITVNDAAPTALSYPVAAAVYTLGAPIVVNTPAVSGTVSAWSVSPELPAGLTLDPTTGAIGGTPTALQPATTYTITATNSGGSTTFAISITVNAEAPTALSYSPTSAVYTRNAVITANVPTITGTATTWSVSPELPAGLTLDPTTGAIRGTPTALQPATAYTVTAANTGGSTTATLSITVNDAAPAALSYATTSAVYTRNAVITANTPTVTGTVTSWAVSPALPTGLVLDTTTGRITGTPSTLQPSTSYTITATNTGGSTTATISITVNDAAPTALSYATTSAVYTRNAVITANTPTVTGTVTSWAVSPALPAGLMLNTTTGGITGTPTALQAATTYTITATNTGGSTTATISITVNDAAPTALSYATTPAVYTVNAVITANTPTVTGTVTSWSVSPALPAGLVLDTTTGRITGTPTAVQGAASYTVTATNGSGSTTTAISITVNEAAPSALSYATTAASYVKDTVIATNTPTVTGTVTSWSASPALPAGLTLDTTTGRITGTPTALQATSSYTITASNGSGSTTATISIEVVNPPLALGYALSCTFSTLAGGAVDCSATTANTTATSDDNHTLYGGQNVHAVLAASGVTYDSGTGLLSFSASLQNKLSQAIGTIDGVTTSPTGIRLILSSTTVNAGAGSITVANADGTSDVPTQSRPYFQLNEKVAPSAVSSSKTVQLNVPSSVTNFTASFVISTKVAVRLVINEVLANPGGTTTDANGEWFELYNAGLFPVNMVGFRIGDSAASGDRPTLLIAGPALTIAPGGYLVFGNTTNTTDNGGVPVDFAYGSFLTLANSLDAVRLISSDGFVSDTNQSTGDVAIQGNPDNVEIDRVWYKSAAISAQNGISRELKNPSLDNTSMDSSNWADVDVGAVYGPGGRGTPGAVNSTFTP